MFNSCYRISYLTAVLHALCDAVDSDDQSILQTDLGLDVTGGDLLGALLFRSLDQTHSLHDLSLQVDR